MFAHVVVSEKFIFFVFGEIPRRSTCMLTLHNYETIVGEGCTNILIAEKTLGFLKDGTISRMVQFLASLRILDEELLNPKKIYILQNRQVDTSCKASLQAVLF